MSAGIGISSVTTEYIYSVKTEKIGIHLFASFPIVTPTGRQRSEYKGIKLMRLKKFYFSCQSSTAENQLLYKHRIYLSVKFFTASQK